MDSLRAGFNYITWIGKKVFGKVTDKQSVDFVNYCNKKVEKISSESSLLLNDLNHSLRDIKKWKDFAISYFSKGPINDLNGKSTERLIECRHLVYWWIKQDKPKYDEIDTLEKLQNCQGVPRDEIYKKEVRFNYCASEAIYFDLPKFPKALFKIASGLKEGEKKAMVFTFNDSRYGTIH